jgi:hypothetical protein
MKVQIKKMKEELKGLAQAIKTSKPEYKQSQRECSLAANAGTNWKELKPFWDAVYAKSRTLSETRDIYRHKHIAYGLLRGKTLIQIENTERCDKPSKGQTCYACNHPNMKYVEALVKEVQDAAAINGQDQTVAS